MSKSKADQDRLIALHNMPCICCEILGYSKLQPLPTEAHHLKGKKYHQLTIPLCGWHHRADLRPGDRKTVMLVGYGPSIEYQGIKGGFKKKWGSFYYLLGKTNKKLKEYYETQP